MSISNWKIMSMTDLICLKDKMVQTSANSCDYQRELVYLGMVLADKLVLQGDLARGEQELEMCEAVVNIGRGGGDGRQKELQHDLRKVKFLQLEVAVLRSQFVRGSDLRSQLSPVLDLDLLPHYCYLCYSAGAELVKLERMEEAKAWLISVLEVVREDNITGIRDASVKLMVKMAAMEVMEKGWMGNKQDVMNLEKFVELLTSSCDQLLVRLDLSRHGILSPPLLPIYMAMSYTQVLDLVVMSHKHKMKEEILEWLLVSDWEILSPNEQEDCLAKIIYSGRKLVMGLAYSALCKYIELVTSAGPLLGGSLGMVLEVGDQSVQNLGVEGRWDKMEEWLKGLAFLSSLTGRHEYFHHFAGSFVVLLVKQQRITEAVSYLSLWRQTLQSYCVNREQLELMVFVLSGNCQGAMTLLLESMVEQKEIGENEIGQSLRVLLGDMEGKKLLVSETLEQLLMGLADKQFFHSLELSKFAVRVAVSLNRDQLVANILYTGKVADWLVVLDKDFFLSKVCWNIGLSCDSLQLKHSLLLLSGQLLSPSDTAGMAARLASVPAGLMALERMKGRPRDELVVQLGKVVDLLEVKVTNVRMQRAVILYKFQLLILSGGKRDKLAMVVDQMARLKDKKGLEAMALMMSRIKKFSMNQLAVKAMIEIQKLEEVKINRERRVVAALELMARNPGWWKDNKVVELVNGIDWRVGGMLGEALKVIWNGWVVLIMDRDEQKSKETGWGKALVLLHNMATEITDHITCRLDQPTITLLRKIRRVAKMEEGE